MPSPITPKKTEKPPTAPELQSREHLVPYYNLGRTNMHNLQLSLMFIPTGGFGCR
jgi:hypothetical protein